MRLFRLLPATFALAATLTFPLTGSTEEKSDLLEPAPPKPTPEIVSPSETVSDAQARLELARVLRNAKRYDEAIAAYRTLLEKEPTNSTAKQELAQVLFWTGKQQESLAILKAIPASELTYDGKVTLASLEITKSQYDKAEALLQECLKENPNDLAVRYRLAETLSWKKNYDASLAEYVIILKARPEDKQVRRKYATVLGWAGRSEEAAAELQKTLD